MGYVMACYLTMNYIFDPNKTDNQSSTQEVLQSSLGMRLWIPTLLYFQTYQRVAHKAYT